MENLKGLRNNMMQKWKRIFKKMIRQKTVFIIGAGASKPYEYPTGQELRERIISDFLAWKRLLYNSWQEAADGFLKTFGKSSKGIIPDKEYQKIFEQK